MELFENLEYWNGTGLSASVVVKHYQTNSYDSFGVLFKLLVLVFEGNMSGVCHTPLQELHLNNTQLSVEQVLFD